jgi:hypothetical protein
MASEKIVFELEIDETGAVKGLNKIDDQVKDIGKSTKKASKGLKGFGKTLSNLGKAAGIVGLLSAAFTILQEAFQNNQKVMDVVNISVTALGKVFNDLFEFLVDNFQPAIDSIVAVFSDIPGTLEKVKKAIIENLENRFNALIKTLGLLGKAISQVFSGNFADAAETAKEAGKTYVDVLTGIENSVDKAAEGIENLIDATIDYTKETINSAAAIEQQKKNTELLALQQQRLREEFDLAAEQQRAIRDDVTRSIEDRIKANERLGEILSEQNKLEQATIQARISNIQRLQTAIGPTFERTKEIFTLQNELAEVEARVAGFRAEQLTNTNGLLREQTEILNELNLIGANEFERRVVEAEQLSELRIETINREIEDATERARLLALVEQELVNEINSINEDAAAKAKALRDKASAEKLAADKIIADAAKIAQDNEVAGVEQVFDAVSKFATEGTELAKGAAIGNVIVDVARGLTAALSGWASLGPFGIAGAVASSAAIIATGAASIKKITSVKAGAKTSASPQSAPPAISASSNVAPPTFQTQADTGQNQLADTISNAINQQPVKAFVVSHEVTTRQQLDRAAQNNATL